MNTVGAIAASGAATVGGLEVNNGESHVNGVNFKVSNGASSDKFTVAASTGNTFVAGTLDTTAAITSLGDISGQLFTSERPVRKWGRSARRAQNFKVTSDGSSSTFEVANVTAIRLFPVL